MGDYTKCDLGVPHRLRKKHVFNPFRPTRIVCAECGENFGEAP